uniref:Carboxypeptidase n=1 Tax=Aceria tosichella TaxID=561515 RepID=A0A6G1S878_9ACAR
MGALHSMVSLVMLILVAQVSVLQAQERSSVDYENPVRTSVDDEIKDLPGLNDAIDFRQYSGYLQADDEGKRFLHYWFVESQNDPANDPILLWLNGGPGCSSLDGLFAELGPFRVNDDGKTLNLNQFAWNKVANVLFLESPVGVGFSYSTATNDKIDDDSTARENYLALKEFFKKFPQYKSNSLYLAGESYAGVYLPTLGVLVDADQELHLEGIAIGNGYLDVSKLSDSLLFFAYYHGLVGKSKWDEISHSCCSDQPPAPKSCQFDCNSTEACMEAQVKLFGDLDGINPYNIYADCAMFSNGYPESLGSSVGQYTSREQVDRQLLRLALNRSAHQAELNPRVSLFEAKEISSKALSDVVRCIDGQLLIDYLNQPDVRKAAHIPDQVQDWDFCDEISYDVLYPLRKGGLSPQIKSLISSKRNLTMLVYNGDIDAVCNFLGDEWFVDDLGRDLIKDYTIWRVDNQVAGWVKHYDGITFATVRGAGHMVPNDKPQEALEMITMFLKSKSHNVLL